jgi:hypothetical protein
MSLEDMKKLKNAFKTYEQGQKEERERVLKLIEMLETVAEQEYNGVILLSELEDLKKKIQEGK